MIETPTPVAPDRVAHAIIPVRVSARLITVLPKYVYQAPLHDVGQSIVDLRMKAYVSKEGVRAVDVAGFGGNIQISDPYKRIVRVEMGGEIAFEPGEPIQLILEELGIRSPALGNVSIYNVDAAY